MIIQSIKFFCALILCGATSLHSLIILTHGFAAGAENTDFNTMWFEPGGNVFEALKKTGAAHGHDVQFFEWDQSSCLGFLRSEHVEAGKGLAQFIINFFNRYKYNARFPHNQEIILVGHSFGGLVCYHASQFLAKYVASVLAPSLFERIFGRAAITGKLLRPQLPHISKIFTLATPYAARTAAAPNYDQVDTVYNIFSFADPVANNPLLGGTVLVPPTFFPDAEKIRCIEIKHADGSGFTHFASQYTPIVTRLFEIAEYADLLESVCTPDHPYTTYILPA